ncbi:hypothetical protein Tco_0164723, partial [Tanacetum coccineum]
MKRVDELNGQGNDQGMGANRGVEGVNWECRREGHGGAPPPTDFLNDITPTIAEPLTRHVSSGKALTWWNSQIHTLSQEVAAGHCCVITDRFHELAWLVLISIIHDVFRMIKEEERIRVLGPSVPLATPTMRPVDLAAYASNLPPGYLARGLSACPRWIRAQGPGETRPNQIATNNGGQDRGNQENQARGRAFMLGAEEACQDPNIVMGLEPNDLGFRYEIKIANGQLVEIDK